MNQSIIVLKFGSSVLTDDAALPAVVHSILGEVRQGRRVLAVVSAFGATTAELLARAHRLDDTPDSDGVAALLATGEAVSAAALRLALGRNGLGALRLDASQLALRTRGAALDAAPDSVDVVRLHAALRRHAVVIVPGFVGCDADGAPTLLGRGGSDLTAVFLANELGATCRLVKDVDGLYDRDPNAAPNVARHYATITFDDALTLDAAIVQPKAIRAARRAKRPFEVSDRHGQRRTIVGAPTTAFSPGEARRSHPVRIAVAGYGTVGQGVVDRLRTLGHDVPVILVRDPDRPRDIDPGPARLVTDPAALLDADVIVDACSDPAVSNRIVDAATPHAIPVVTASKVLATARLQAMGRPHAWSAAAGGGVPILETIRSLRARGESVRGVRAVINGTATAVLTELERGRSLPDAIAHAQAAGYCEVDPRRDLDGTDAAHKAQLIAHAAFDVVLPEVSITRDGIDDALVARCRAARRRGAVVRQITTVTAHGASVALQEIPAAGVLGHTLDAGNAALIATDTDDTIALAGRGAGRWPTATAVVADVLDVLDTRSAWRGTAEVSSC